MSLKQSIVNWLGDLAIKSGYDAAWMTRHRRELDWSRRQPKAEDYELSGQDRVNVRQKLIGLQRNDGIVAGIIKRFADNVVGSGITPQAKTSSRAWNDEAEAFWGNWSNVCDYRQRQNMRELQTLDMQQKLVAGDLGYQLMANGQMMPIEGERIATPAAFQNDAAVVDGCRFDPASGIMVGVYVMQRDDKGVIRNINEYTYVPREDLIFMGHIIRFDQIRGVPMLAPIVNLLDDFKDLQEAQLEKARLEAKYAVTLKGGNSVLGARGTAMTTSTIEEVPYEKVFNGMVKRLKDNEVLEVVESKTPSSVFPDYSELLIRMIGVAVSLPYEFLFLDFSKGNYSSSRAGLIQAYRTFRAEQQWLTSRKMQRLWNWRIAKAMKNGELSRAPVVNGISEWFKVEWSYPEFAWVDPQSEAQGKILEYNMGVTTLTDVCQMKGRDYEDQLNTKAAEIEKAATKAKEMNAKLGTSLTYQDFISTNIPGSKANQPTTTRPEERANE